MDHTVHSKKKICGSRELYQSPKSLTLPTISAADIARRVGGRRRAEQRLMPTVILYDGWYYHDATLVLLFAGQNGAAREGPATSRRQVRQSKENFVRRVLLAGPVTLDSMR
jgi:hypothetical protein